MAKSVESDSTAMTMPCYPVTKVSGRCEITRKVVVENFALIALHEYGLVVELGNRERRHLFGVFDSDHKDVGAVLLSPIRNATDSSAAATVPTLNLLWWFTVNPSRFYDVDLMVSRFRTIQCMCWFAASERLSS